MNQFERGIINLVKSAIMECPTETDCDFDWKSAYNLALKHQVIPMLYYGIINSKLSPPDDIMNNIELDTYKSISISTNQMYEINKIKKSFIDNNIDFMPLKGCILKNLYPKAELRAMSDADILIKTEQYEKIKPIMLDLGFNELFESDHELIWDKKYALHLELHKRLIPSYNKDYYSYFKDGWQLSEKLSGTEYKMKDEENFIYLFTHYAKHYRDGGIGIRHITDFYVFLKANPNINMSYIENELKKLKLFEFYKNTMNTLSVWFDNEKDTEITDFITSKIINSGSYGTNDAHVLSKAVKVSKSVENKSKLQKKELIYLIFLPYKNMTIIYPFLKKVPFLLPFMWVVRLVNALIFKQKTIKTHHNNLEKITVENVSEYQNELDFVGLDYNFKD